MYAGKNLKALLEEMGYSVARFVGALNGDIPQSRIEAWIKGMGAPKVNDTKILCNFFKISSEQLHGKLFTGEEIKMIIKNRSLSVKAGEIHNSTITQNMSDPNEVFYLKDKISMLERIIEEKQKLIDVLMNKKSTSSP